MKSRAPLFGLAESIYKSHACQRPRCQTCEFITPLTDIRGPKSTFTIRDHFTCTSENLVYCISCRSSPISKSAKLSEVSGVALVSSCEAYATTSLDFLWHNISTPPVTVLQMSWYEVCVCVEVPTSSANNWKRG